MNVDVKRGTRVGVSGTETCGDAENIAESESQTGDAGRDEAVVEHEAVVNVGDGGVELELDEETVAERSWMKRG